MSLSASFTHLFKQIIIYVVMVSLQLGTLAQSTQAYAQLAQPANSSANVVAESNAYSNSLAFNIAPKFSVAEAQRKANEIDLSQVNPNELFGQGFDLFQYNPALRPNGEAENVLLAKLQNGELTVGSPEYLEATQIAQQRLRDAYSISLVPPEPKKIPKWKMITGVVVGAILTFVTAGAAAPFIASALTGVSVAAASAALTAGFFAGTMLGAAITAIAGIAGAYVGAVISAGITTGSFSQALRAGEKALVSGSVKAIVSTIVASAFGLVGLSGLDGIDGSLSNVAMNTLSGGITQTILNGGSFADNLKTAAVNSVVDEIAKGAANTIGDAFPNLDGTNLANYAAHAVLGCASAAAKGADCAAGAIGAMTGEAAAASGFLDAAANSTIGRSLNKDETIFFGGLVGGTVAAAASSADQVQANFATGTSTASNAVTNNYLNHLNAKLRADLLAERDKCIDEACRLLKTGQIDELNRLDRETDAKIKEVCKNPSSDLCKTLTKDITVAAASYDGKNLTGSGVRNEANTTIADADMYSARVNSPTGFGIVTGGAATVLGIVAAPIVLTEMGIRAAAGDTQAWQDLKDIAVNVAITVTDLPAAAKRMLDAANAAEAAGDYAKAAQIRTELVGNAALIGYSGFRAAHSAAGEIAAARTVTGLVTTRVSNGITLNSNLPDPAAGLGYTPKVLNSANSNIANSQINGYLGELKLANEVASLPNQSVIKYGDVVGTHGADIISVNRATGEVTLWDNKFRSNPVTMPSSPTFEPGSSALTSALADAQVSIRNSNLPAEAKNLALQNLSKGNFITNTPGSGAVKNSTTVRFCSGIPC